MTHAKRLVAGLALALSLSAHADVITEWNLHSAAIVTESRIGTPPAIRLMAILQTAALRAVESPDATSAAFIDAAVASAHRTSLLRLLPAQKALIDSTCAAALAKVPDGPAKDAGVAAGERAANEVLAQRLDDGAAAEPGHRPYTTAGRYVPTAPAAVPQWASRKPWLLDTPSQVRPAAPPALQSSEWARDFNEVRELGSRNSTRRTSAQTEIARFWDYSLPAIYHGVVRSVADQPGRDVRQNARLFAAVAQGMDDAMIAVFDAKYHFALWRPVTAIRNGDIDGNDATPRDASWVSLIEAPMHPEYPSGHAILASTVATVLRADVGRGPWPELKTTSPTAGGATRTWRHIDDFVAEVSEARVLGGIHYRFATQAAERMGQAIGQRAARLLQPQTVAVACVADPVDRCRM